MATAVAATLTFVALLPACATIVGCAATVGVPAAIVGAGTAIAQAVNSYGTRDFNRSATAQSAALGAAGGGFVFTGAAVFGGGGGAIITRAVPVGGGVATFVDRGRAMVNSQGFQMTQYYYNNLVNGGRADYAVRANNILQNYTSKTPDPKGYEGFYKYVYDGWELIYNPTTNEISHLSRY